MLSVMKLLFEHFRDTSWSHAEYSVDVPFFVLFKILQISHMYVSVLLFHVHCFPLNVSFFFLRYPIIFCPALFADTHAS